MIYCVGIVFDFVMIVGIDLTADWHFFVGMSIIGLLITIHSIRFAEFGHIWQKGKALYSFDSNLAFIMVFAYYALPSIYKGFVYYMNFIDGRNAFLYLYPLLEYAMEAVTHYILHSTNAAIFY